MVKIIKVKRSKMPRPLALAPSPFEGITTRFVPSAEDPTSIVTLLQDGTEVGWDTCGVCHRYFTHCTCAAGVGLARHVQYFVEVTPALMDGTPPPTLTSPYGTRTRPGEVVKRNGEEREQKPFSRQIADGLVKGRVIHGKPQPGGLGSRALAVADAAERLAERRRQVSAATSNPEAPAMDLDNLDLAKVNEAAAKQAEADVENATPRRVIRRKK